METVLMDGRKLKAKKIPELKERADKLIAKGITPHLVVIQVGDNPASTVYIGHKQKFCEKLGIKSTKISLSNDITFEQLKEEVEKLNNDNNVDGILIQFPLPKTFSKRQVLSLIDPTKDVDGIHPFNQGANFTRAQIKVPIPCTANGIMEFLKEYNIPLEGKTAVVIGRSNIVGRPTSYLLSNANATTTLVHSKTNKETVKQITKLADIIILATGYKDVITPDMVKEGVTIIDVGIIKMEDGKLRGDVLYKDFMGIAGHITPVPGGVGPMTVTMLMDNILTLTENNRGK